MRQLLKEIVFILFFLSISFSYACEKKEEGQEFYPGCIEGEIYSDFCEQKYNEFQWGDKWAEIDKQIEDLSELIRQSVLKDDYSKLKDYIILSVNFYSDKTRVEKKYKKYNVYAKSFEEFESNFRFVIKRLMEHDPSSLGDYYIRSDYSCLVGHHYRVWLDIICIASSDVKILNKPIISREKDKCSAIKVIIDSISLW